MRCGLLWSVIVPALDPRTVNRDRPRQGAAGPLESGERVEASETQTAEAGPSRQVQPSWSRTLTSLAMALAQSHRQQMAQLLAELSVRLSEASSRQARGAGASV